MEFYLDNQEFTNVNYLRRNFNKIGWLSKRSFEQKLDRFFDKNKKGYKLFQNLSQDTGLNNEAVELY